MEVTGPERPLRHGPLEDKAENAARDGRDDQRRQISDARHVQEKIGAESAHHVERAMREIDDVEHPEDHGEPETQERVERAVDQSHQKLRVESLHNLSFPAQSPVDPKWTLARTSPAG